MQSRELRSSQMKDLIFRPPGSEWDSTLSARASLVYVEPPPGLTATTTTADGGGDGGNENDLEYERVGVFPKGKTTVFSRVVTAKGTGEYQINGKVVTFKQYETKLASIGVLLKARNFLVFQGDVEGMARKNPKQLVEMFENLSGSADLKDEYDAALKAKEEAEQRTIFAFNKTKEHKSERRVLKEQKVCFLCNAFFSSRCICRGMMCRPVCIISFLVPEVDDFRTKSQLLVTIHSFNYRKKHSGSKASYHSGPRLKLITSFGYFFTSTLISRSSNQLARYCKNHN